MVSSCCTKGAPSCELQRLLRTLSAITALVIIPAFWYLWHVSIGVNVLDYLPLAQSEKQTIVQYGSFCVIRNAIKREPGMYDGDANRITLALHASSSVLDDKILDQVNSWDGPVSLSVAVINSNLRRGMEEAKAKISKYEPLISDKVSVHLFYPTSSNCSEDDIRLENITTDSLYPVQAARNIAHMMSQTKYLVITDYEYIFSYNFEALVRELAEKELTKNPKEVLVFRLFEVDNKVSKMPQTKHELYELYKQKKAIQFHAVYAPGCHEIAGIDEWFNASSTESNITVSKIVPYNNPSWEPQLVSLSDIPYHDENFPFLSGDNTSLRWELCRMNYTFAVMNEVFAVHRGIKTKKTRKNGNLIRLAQSRAKKAKKLFRERMNKMYASTEKSCPAP